MTNLKRVATLFMTAMLALSVVGVAFTGGAAAITAPTVTATDDGTGATTDHTISTDYDNTDSPSLQEIQIDYEAGDVSGLGADDVTVSIAGTDETVSAVEAADDTTLTVTLDATVTLSDTDTIEVTLSGVENPHNAGSYDVGVELFDDTGTSVDSDAGTDALSIVVGDTPSVTSNSALSEGATVSNYNGSSTAAETLEVEAYTDNLEATIMSADGHEIGTVSDVTVVSQADSSTDTPGTYEIDISHADLRGLDVGINENADFQVAVANNDADAPANEFTSTLENGDEVSQIHIFDAESDARADYTNNSVTVFDRTIWDRTDAEIDPAPDVSSNTDEIYVSSSDENVSDEIDAAIPDDAESGDRLAYMMNSDLDGSITYVFYDEPGEKIDGNSVDAAEDDYIVLNDEGPHVVNLADDTVADDSTVDMTMAANDLPSPGDLREDLDYSLTQSFGVLTYGIPLLGATLLVSRRRIGE
ncbi:DUF2808 domain-containing protein (plasmid) [Halobiforma lacisalsi AJ5]|uniref:DUF2808 domain-containing protein n=1 Tax=Natronobacterium lacisalsi AJ5 TaxID=358396 RepID=M0LUY6_NATLA|nr:DUF2808 domain-containing protein [Halobiforma lacisalsi]APX00201.1 DUF2808 domain-containing protein [Halobiforma lacisalsi AJ5]EMA37382.1 hypothetical protein C445_00796 [Halobiforma lacisalsi AJ5]